MPAIIDHINNQRSSSLFSSGLTWFGLPMLLVLLSSCNMPSRAEINPSLPPTKTIVHLPDTWTLEPTPTIPPSYTPAPSDTPAPSVTLTPYPAGSTATAASPTSDVLAEPYPDCRYFASQPGVRLLLAPFVDPYRVLPTMEPGRAYPAVIDKPTYTLLLDNGQPAGWVDYRMLALEMDGADCLSRRDEREVLDFPNLCFFTPKFSVKAYFDSSLTQESHDLSPQNKYILLQYQDVYFSTYGHAGPSFFVSRNEVTTSGDCLDIPSAGIINRNTALYSQPDGKSTNVISALLVGQPVFIQTKTNPGTPPPEASAGGKWAQIRIPTTSGGLDGWCWSEYLDYR
jgi:hypothetical protein